MNYDLIGDIHGYADELVQILEALGYRAEQGVYARPDRQVIFLGDFIDRGPQIREVLELVRPMVERGNAFAVMGNHEFNAIAFNTPDPERPGEFLRRHTSKNVGQHTATLDQLTREQLDDNLEWFRTLPQWLDLPGLRAVHACWDDDAIRRIETAHKFHGGLNSAFLRQACRKGDPLFHAVETVLKGKEAKLPAGASFRDGGGHERTEIRTRWYLSPEYQTYRTYALQSDPIHVDLPLAADVVAAAKPYPATAKPVFFGHFWLEADRPFALASNVACLDFSVAKGGLLCAYRWNGEQTIDADNFVIVPARDRGVVT